MHVCFIVIVNRRNGSGDHAVCRPCIELVILCHKNKKTLANLVNVTIANTQLQKLGESRQLDDRFRSLECETRQLDDDVTMSLRQFRMHDFCVSTIYSF